MRLLVLLYAVVAYVLLLVVVVGGCDFLLDAGFLTRGIDAGPASSVPVALAVDLGLLCLFGVQHSVMARPGFKQLWARHVPPAVERSTFVLLTDAILLLTFWQWRPLPAVLWSVSGAARWAFLGLWGVGLGLMLYSSFLTDHFELFGLRGAWLHFTGAPHTPPVFRERAIYRYLRHPMMLGIIVWFWATPVMTAGHLLFALGFTAYIVVGVAFEERDLVRAHPEYAAYRSRVPAFLPLPRKR